MSYGCLKMSSPVGELTLVGGPRGLAAVLWANDNPRRVPLAVDVEAGDHPVLRQAESELSEYFAGRRQTFSVPLDLVGTPFQKQVWSALCDIPFGQTRSYGDLARAIGNPKAVRAVGAANGRNPISIIVPCHRVIGSTGELTGFAGGLAVKEALLKIEGRVTPGDQGTLWTAA